MTPEEKRAAAIRAAVKHAPPLKPEVLALIVRMLIAAGEPLE